MTDKGVTPWNKLRLVALYALRYQKTQTANIASLINLLLSNGVPQEDARVSCFIVLRSFPLILTLSSWSMCY